MISINFIGQHFQNVQISHMVITVCMTALHSVWIPVTRPVRQGHVGENVNRATRETTVHKVNIPICYVYCCVSYDLNFYILGCILSVYVLISKIIMYYTKKKGNQNYIIMPQMTITRHFVQVGHAMNYKCIYH